MKFSSMVVALLMAAFAGCKSHSNLMLVPLGEVEVYPDIQGETAMGTSSTPLRVVRIMYLDKSSYIVEVDFHGQSGYVKSGAFHLRESK